MAKPKTTRKKKAVKKKSPAPSEDGIPMAQAYVDPGPTQQLPIIQVLSEIEEKLTKDDD